MFPDVVGQVFAVAIVTTEARGEEWYVVFWRLTGPAGAKDTRGERTKDEGPFQTEEEAKRRLERYQNIMGFA